MVSHPRGQTEKATPQSLRIDDVERYERSRVRNAGCDAPLQVNSSIVLVESNRITCTLLSPRVSDLKRPLDRMVLRGKVISMDYRTLDPADFALIHQTAQRTRILLQFIIRQFGKPEILPPSRFLLTAVPLQYLS
jgi:hypothetical protein